MSKVCAIIIALTLGAALCACNNSVPAEVSHLPKSGAAPPPNDFTVQDLTDHSVLIDVPAGEWRMVRLNRNFFPTNGQTITLIQASFPTPGAEPWIGFGHQSVRLSTGEMIGNASFIIQGVRGDIPYASTIETSLTNVEQEVALIFGSRFAPTRFYLGVVPENGQLLPSTDNLMAALLGPGETVDGFNARIAEAADGLARRPLLPAGMESGRGGFGAVFIRFYLSSGEIYSASSGPLKLVESTLAEAPAGVKLQQNLLIQSEEPMPESGLFFYGAGVERQAGLCQWNYQVNAPEFHRNNKSTYACDSTYGPNTFVATDTEGSNIYYGPLVHLSTSAPTTPGTFKFELSHTFTGRDGGSVQGYAAPLSSLVLSQTLVFFGYINADFEALYGWQIGLTELPY